MTGLGDDWEAIDNFPEFAIGAKPNNEFHTRESGSYAQARPVGNEPRQSALIHRRHWVLQLSKQSEH